MGLRIVNIPVEIVNVCRFATSNGGTFHEQVRVDHRCRIRIRKGGGARPGGSWPSCDCHHRDGGTGWRVGHRSTATSGREARHHHRGREQGKRLDDRRPSQQRRVRTDRTDGRRADGPAPQDLRSQRVRHRRHHAKGGAADGGPQKRTRDHNVVDRRCGLGAGVRSVLDDEVRPRGDGQGNAG